MSELEPAAGTPALFTEDRGIRTTRLHSLDQHVAFGEMIRQYQAKHPNTIVRTTSRLENGVGFITVRWWQRGTEQP